MKRTSAAIASLLLAACNTTSVTSSQPITAPSRPQDWGSFSLKLEQGMTEQQAIAAIGYSPDSASVTTCGPRDQPNKLWDCRLLKYGDLGTRHDLMIYEEKIGGAWYVNSWRVF
jgi:hypothetical protein